MVAVDTAGPWAPADTFGRRLRTLRDTLGMKPEELAPICGLKPSTWRTWEKGTAPRGLDQIVTQIVAATRVDRDWLMFGYGEARSQNWKFLHPVPVTDGQMELSFSPPPTLLTASSSP